MGLNKQQIPPPHVLINTMRTITTISLLLLLSTSIFSQDSIKIESLLSVETRGTGLLASGYTNFDCITCLFETISDNPIHHFAIYSGLTHTLSVNDKFHFETGVFLEERSFSGGSNTLANWVVYPKILLTGIDTISFLNQSISYKLSGGDFWAEDFNDMLRIHNMDYQGLLAELSLNRHTLGFLVIGDLSYNIGLGLHQYHKFFIRSDFGKFQNTLSFADNQLSEWRNHTLPRDFNVGNNLRYRISERVGLESQIEFRINDDLGTSVAAGIGVTGQFKTLKFGSRLKYYSANFNNGYFSTLLFYRNGARYVGQQLYPLKNYYRDYSQWGNYTRVQNRNLLGFELTVSWNQPINKNIYFFTDIDLNIIGDPETQTGNTIPLYNLGLSVRFFDLIKTDFFFTNKHMNLDTFYQTFQASVLPFFAGTVSIDLNKMPLKTMYLTP